MSEKYDDKVETTGDALKESSEGQREKGPKRRRKTGRSMFGPIVLITTGVFLLLANLDMLPELDWRAALRLWPLALIFVGLNVIARQFGRPVGTFLSAIVALMAVAVFAYALLYADQIPVLGDRLATSAAVVKEERVTFPAADVEQAEVFVDFAAPGGRVFALSDSNELLDAQVSYTGDLYYESDLKLGQAMIRLATSGAGDRSFWSDPSSWFGDDKTPPWQVGLSSRVATDLELDLGSGSVDMALERIGLTSLLVDGGSGTAELALPPGDYDMEYDVGSGSVVMTLPAGGAHDFVVDGGSGRLTVLVPAGLAVRLSTEGGSGGLNLDGDLFQAIGSVDDDEGRWQTAGYEEALDRVDMFVDIGSGSVTFKQK